MRRRKIRVVVVAALALVVAAAMFAPAGASAHRGRDHHRRDRHERSSERDHDRHDKRHHQRAHHDKDRRAQHAEHRGHDRGRHDDRCRGPRNGAGPIRVLADGLNGPFGLDVEGRTAYVAESDAGKITKVDLCTGRQRTAVDDLPGPTSVAVVDGLLAIVTGESGGPPEEDGDGGDGPNGDEPPVAMAAVRDDDVRRGDHGRRHHRGGWDHRNGTVDPLGGSALYRARPGGDARLWADLLKFELKRNPDGQRQFGPNGEPLDALSNPFDVLAHGRGGVLVADAGANAVLKVSRKGHVSKFFVPPVINTGACAGMPNNDPQHTGCDPVPTGLAYGPRGTIYVSTLTAEVPGEGRVYVLDARSGKVRRVISGFDGPTGVAVGDHGELYVSEVLHGAPQTDGPPPPGFDPSTVGRIVKVGWYGERECAAVTMPTGLDFEDGKLYASAWSIAGFLGIQDAGQVVQVGRRAFRDCDGAPTPPPGPPGAPNGPSTPPEGPPAPPTNGDPTPPADGPPAPPTNGDPTPPADGPPAPPTGGPPAAPTDGQPVPPTGGPPAAPTDGEPAPLEGAATS